ncbi:MAG: (d)CMP kinase [Cyclobacteriaceae bacterium]|nr:(d)CMP kinase [Cyclobacteriaceae bacterium]MCH8516281.1 (d)CMP kinase [Cyclobacteriaceae bacterium]
MHKIIIAIDGYSACGKSSTAKEIAARLNYQYIDTGAMYRAVTLYFVDNYIDITNPKSVENALAKIEIRFLVNGKNGESEVFLNGLKVESQIREMRISQRVSEVAALAAVRKKLVDEQRKMGKKKGIVMDGRDIGSNVFPEAELKVFMTADFQVRAERRQQELLEKGQLSNFDEVLENLKQRDKIDTERKENPLIQCADAVVIDTTFLTFEEQVQEILQHTTSAMLDSLQKKNTEVEKK